MTEAEALVAMEPLQMASPPGVVGSGVGVITTGTTTTTTTGIMTKTPPRNNYASQHTPIASIKRPRSSIEKQSQNTTPKRSSAGTGATPSESSSSALSPLHPPTAVVRDTRAVEEKIFSPVLHWDGHEEDDEEEEDRHRHDPLTHDSHSTSTSTARKVSDNDEDCCEDDNLSSHSDASLSVTEMDVDDEFNPWQFIKSLPPYSHVAHLTPPVNLPPIDASRFDLTLVLDLDETLVHCTVEVCDDADFVFPVLFHGMEYQVYVRLRPHLFEFLKRIQGLKFETVIFTASQKVYADELLNRIDPGTLIPWCCVCSPYFVVCCLSTVPPLTAYLASAPGT